MSDLPSIGDTVKILGLTGTVTSVTTRGTTTTATLAGAHDLILRITPDRVEISWHERK